MEFRASKTLQFSIITYDTELVQCRFPAPDLQGPFLREIVQGQVEKFVHRLVIGERSPVPGHLSQRQVQRFNGIGGVDSLRMASG